MARVRSTPKKLGELIDDIERIREELLVIQNSLQKMESVGSATPLPRLPKSRMLD
jgi:hypothetical protein